MNSKFSRRLACPNRRIQPRFSRTALPQQEKTMLSSAESFKESIQRLVLIDWWTISKILGNVIHISWRNFSEVSSSTIWLKSSKYLVLKSNGSYNRNQLPKQLIFRHVWESPKYRFRPILDCQARAWAIAWHPFSHLESLESASPYTPQGDRTLCIKVPTLSRCASQVLGSQQVFVNPKSPGLADPDGTLIQRSHYPCMVAGESTVVCDLVQVPSMCTEGFWSSILSLTRFWI